MSATWFDKTPALFIPTLTFTLVHSPSLPLQNELLTLKIPFFITANTIIKKISKLFLYKNVLTKYYLLGCNTTESRRNLQTFRQNPVIKVRDDVHSSKTSKHFDQTTRHHSHRRKNSELNFPRVYTDDNSMFWTVPFEGCNFIQWTCSQKNAGTDRKGINKWKKVKRSRLRTTLFPHCYLYKWHENKLLK